MNDINIKHYLDYLVRLLDVITDWQVLLVIILLVYRKTIITTIPALIIRLTDRTKKLVIGGTSIEFADYVEIKDTLKKITDPELQNEVISKIDTSVVVDSNAVVDEVDNDEEEGEEGYIEEQDGEDVEFGYTFENLKKEK